jgi:hypothetical protein
MHGTPLRYLPMNSRRELQNHQLKKLNLKISPLGKNFTALHVEAIFGRWLKWMKALRMVWQLP